jgi:hypothetical protein
MPSFLNNMYTASPKPELSIAQPSYHSESYVEHEPVNKPVTPSVWGVWEEFGKSASGACFRTVEEPLHRLFTSFAPVRHSMNTERKNPSQFSRPGNDSGGAVISIAPSPPRQPSPERTRDVSRSADAHDPSDPSPLSEQPLRGEIGTCDATSALGTTI